MAKRVLRMDPLEIKGRVPATAAGRTHVFDPVEVIVEVPATDSGQSLIAAYVSQAAEAAVELPYESPPPLEAAPSGQPDPAESSLAGRQAISELSDEDLLDAIDSTLDARDTAEDAGFFETLNRNLGFLFSERFRRAVQRVTSGMPVDEDAVADFADSGLSTGDLDRQANEDLKDLLNGTVFLLAGRDEAFERFRQASLKDLYLTKHLLDRLRDLSPVGPALEFAEMLLSSQPPPSPEELLDWLAPRRLSPRIPTRRPSVPPSPAQPRKPYRPPGIQTRGPAPPPPAAPPSGPLWPPRRPYKPPSVQTSRYSVGEGEILAEIPVPPGRTVGSGRHMEREMALALRDRFPQTEFRFRFGRGTPDVEWVGGRDPGFDIADFKPARMAKWYEFRKQVRTWGDEGWRGRKAPETFRAGMIAYDSEGTVYIYDLSKVGPRVGLE